LPEFILPNQSDADFPHLARDLQNPTLDAFSGA
jgi:hypothetical protein